MKFKRLVTIMLTLSVAVSLVAFPVAAVDYSDVVAPLYIGLEDATADLAISSNGYANCSGSAYPDVMSIDEMCRALSIGKKTGYKLLQTGQIRFLKIGRAYRIPKINLLEYLQVIRPE